MRTVYELNREQLIGLKQQLLCEQFDVGGCSPSWYDISNADLTISDQTVFEAYAGVAFVPDDFSTVLTKV